MPGTPPTTISPISPGSTLRPSISCTSTKHPDVTNPIESGTDHLSVGEHGRDCPVIPYSRGRQPIHLRLSRTDLGRDFAQTSSAEAQDRRQATAGENHPYRGCEKVGARCLMPSRLTEKTTGGKRDQRD